MTDDATGGTRTTRLLVVSDLHLRPTGEPFPVADLPVERHDAVVSLGDVVDENSDHDPDSGAAYEERGRAFFEHLDGRGTPVLAVPGNHDPVATTRRLTAGLDAVTPLHRASAGVDAGGTACHVAGWGCEQFDFPSALLTPDYPNVSLDDGSPETPDAVADALLQSAGRYVAGALTESELADRLGIDGRDAQAHFQQSLATLEERFEDVVATVRETPEPVVVASHVSPFAVPFDCREPHAHEGDYHFGSLALRLALAETGPVACLSGHTHQQGFSVIETATGHAYVYNPGESGVASVTIDGSGTVQVDELACD
ncbi:metallophosphoesterase family protein [Halomicrobium salinisoli]|uniref:metallophosphoesterase family protein n=1 Tax=Halomicrobium salinisoli TaxID=2878391 RepID=UPI001CF01D9D|nr:metallophosphoesterase family protein [Halomicrobium salinisoli]